VNVDRLFACNHAPHDRASSFLQTDPIGYGDGLNWHVYVGSDPINNVDPNGLNGVSRGGTVNTDGLPDIVVNGSPLDLNGGTLVTPPQFTQFGGIAVTAIPSFSASGINGQSLVASKMSDEERDQARKEDEEECFKLKTAQEQARCFAQASERDADRVRGVRPRPLFPDRQPKPNKKPKKRIPLLRLPIIILDILIGNPCIITPTPSCQRQDTI